MNKIETNKNQKLASISQLEEALELFSQYSQKKQKYILKCTILARKKQYSVKRFIKMLYSFLIALSRQSDYLKEDD